MVFGSISVRCLSCILYQGKTLAKCISDLRRAFKSPNTNLKTNINYSFNDPFCEEKEYFFIHHNKVMNELIFSFFVQIVLCKRNWWEKAVSLLFLSNIKLNQLKTFYWELQNCFLWNILCLHTTSVYCTVTVHCIVLSRYTVFYYDGTRHCTSCCTVLYCRGIRYCTVTVNDIVLSQYTVL